MEKLSSVGSPLSTQNSLFQEALEKHRNGEGELALTLYRQIVAQAPDHAEALFYGALVLEEVGQHEEALPWLIKAHELRPALPFIAYQLGVCQVNLGEHQLAITSFEKVVAADNQHWLAAYNLGVAQYASGSFVDAAASYSLAAEINPEDGDIFFNLGLTYKKIGEFDKARLAYDHALQLMPDDPEVHYNLGKLLFEMGLKNEAISSFEMAIALKPDFSAALTNLGVLYCVQKADEKAIEIYKKLVAIGHKPASSQHILDALNGRTTQAAPLEYVRDLYDDFAAHFEKKLLGNLDYAVPENLVNFLNKHSAPGTSFNRMLDLGCGTGLCGLPFRAMTEVMIGVDLSAKMLAKADKKNIYDQLIADDILLYLSTARENHDLIIAGDVLIYLGGLRQFFALLPGQLSQSGKILFSTEHSESDGYVLTSSGRYAHSPSYIQRLASENGLVVLAVEVVRARRENGNWVTGDLYLIGHAP